MAERPIITEHALVRYLERIKEIEVERVRQAGVQQLGRPPTDPELVRSLKARGVPIDSIRAALSTAKVRQAILMGAKSVVCGHYKLIIEGDVVVTIVPVWEKRAMRPSLRKGQARVVKERERTRRIDVRTADLVE